MKKILLLLLAAGLLFGSGRVQNSLNGDRERLGITRMAPLENAPPMLAFTTVALGGFRGLISNMLWIRATQLQDDGKYFEMMQLADWITKLEPHFAQVWANQAWNMAYNISVKFKDFGDRWRWVRAGIELLRDEGITKYNPTDPLLYRELSWLFQHKMGANMDDANVYYKVQWLGEMSAIFGESGKPNFDELANPKTDDAKTRARLLTTKYKMNPLLMKDADERFGPLEWRLPEASAVYWAYAGLKMVETVDTNRIDKFNVMSLRRSIYQSMQSSFHHGRLIRDPFARRPEFGPNLDLIPKVNSAYEEMMRESPEDSEIIGRAHRNFLGDAVYYLYSHNRNREAASWYAYLAKNYGDRPLLLVNQTAYPTNLTYDVYASSRIQEDVGENSRDRVKSHIEGFLTSAYKFMALDDLDRYYGLKNNQARRLHKRFMDAIGPDSTVRIGLPPFEDIDRDVRNRVLDPEQGFPFEARARIRAELGMPPEPRSTPGTNAPATTTPAIPSTNSVPSSTGATI